MPTVAQQHVARRAQGSAPAPVAGPERSAPVVLMVSGGADSTALLLMACTSTLDLADGRGPARIARERLHVLHVNHHLRGEASDADEAFVRDLCERFGVPLCVEHVSFDNLNGENLEAAARDARYAAARRYVRELTRAAGTPRSAARIVTAHTASDRAETFFMNAIKGSGPAGLSSIPRRRNIIVRPLLDSTHEELTAYLEMSGQSWREDETNRDTSYLRNYVRHKLMPLARERNSNLERAVSAGCDILGDEDAFMSQLAATALRSCLRRTQEGLVVLDGARLASSEIAVARRMVRLAVRMLDPEVRLEMRHVEGVLAAVGVGSGSLTLPGGIDARMEFGALTLRTATAREELVAAWLGLGESMALANGRVLRAEYLEVPAGADPVAFAREMSGASPRDLEEPALRHPVACVDTAALGYDPRDLVSGGVRARFWVDAPAPGDVIHPLGMSGRSRKLSDVFGSRRIPVADRPAVPVVRTAPGGSIVWAAGICLDDRFKCTAHTQGIIRLTMHELGAEA
ncbi:tRNA lysidine(34) synthetase TilS [Collinsella vaginalis]|uniref:tRNA lysidine(34) synthetase TilS n=1 Tax=Collinsella vaginalis TaxID=1870987 RepID=UPI0015C514A7|nr:tRNA lysidine(34) synthetase TilS [Collinsella vaginalis]